MSSDIARSVITELKAENKKLREQVKILKQDVKMWEHYGNPSFILRSFAKWYDYYHNKRMEQEGYETKHYTPHRRRRK